MGIILKSESIADIFLLTEIIENFTKENNLTLLQITEKDEEIIQKKYDEIMNDMSKALGGIK